MAAGTLVMALKMGRMEELWIPVVVWSGRDVFQRLLSQIAIMHRVDNVLFSHGGLTVDFLRRLNADLPDADIDEVLAAVNETSEIWYLQS